MKIDKEPDYMHQAPIKLTEQELLLRVALDLERVTHAEDYDPYPEREVLRLMEDVRCLNRVHQQQFGRPATDVLLEKLGMPKEVTS